MDYKASEAMPINRAANTKVVTKRDDRNACNASATQRSIVQRLRAPWQWPRCSPNAVRSIGEVSAVELKAEVLQLGMGGLWAAMMISARRPVGQAESGVDGRFEATDSY